MKAQSEILEDPAFDSIAWVNALTYQMIYEQPVIYEMKNIKSPTLLIIGQLDRTIVGKNLLGEAQKNSFGQYPALGKNLKQQIRNSELVELDHVGHIPHIQAPELFKTALFDFLE